MINPFLSIIFTILIMTSLLSTLTLASANNVYGQNDQMNSPSPANSQTRNANTNTMLSSTTNGGQIISVYIPLTGLLSKSYYIHLADLSGFHVGEVELSMQVPCDYSGKPVVGIIAGVAPNFNTMNVGNPIGVQNLDGKPAINLSYKGVSCLYKTSLPAGITDIDLINISGANVSFAQGFSQYGVTITAQIR